MAQRAIPLLLVTAGLLLLAVELDRAPETTLAVAGTFGGVWAVRRSIGRRWHRRSTRLHRQRREIVTNAVITMVAVILASVVFALLDVSADFLPAAAAAASTDAQTPWAAVFLLEGALAVVGLAWTILGILALRRRPTRRHHTAAPPAPLAH